MSDVTIVTLEARLAVLTEYRDRYATEARAIIATGDLDDAKVRRAGEAMTQSTAAGFLAGAYQQVLADLRGAQAVPAAGCWRCSHPLAAHNTGHRGRWCSVEGCRCAGHGEEG